MNIYTHVVYWFHHTHHTSPVNQGYIGVTDNTKRRFNSHLSQLKRQQHSNPHFQNAFNIDNNMIHDILYIGSEIECYIQESHFRSHPNIGWNISVGGKTSSKQSIPITSVDGITFASVSSAAQYYKVNVDTVYKWIKRPSRHAWTVHKIQCPNGLEFSSVKEASIYYNIGLATMYRWIKNPQKAWRWPLHSNVERISP